MNAASIVVASIVAVLLIVSAVCSWKNRKNKCGGNCSGCALQCKEKSMQKQ